MNQDYKEIIRRFKGKRILLVGDLMLDVYIQGSSTRLSPEGPVPVINIQSRRAVPGGAAHVACNLRALGCEVLFCSLAGDDEAGHEALQLLMKDNIPPEHIVLVNGRKTITKTRIIAGTQTVARMDQGDEHEPPVTFQTQLADKIKQAIVSCDAVLVSDYHKGTITEIVKDALCETRAHQLLAVDSKRLAFFRELQPDIIKPNYDEFLALTRQSAQHSGRREQVISLAPVVQEVTGAAVIVFTLDKDGCVVCEQTQDAFCVDAPLVAEPRVAGAGDTFLSAFLATYLVSGDVHASAEISIAASAIAIQKEGTSTCNAIELCHYLGWTNKIISSSDDLAELSAHLTSEGKRIVFTNGCFDILHSGHVEYLRAARTLGDVLIVGINTDDSIQRLKGPGRPINSLSDRLNVLAALSCIDFLIPFGNALDDTPEQLIRLVKPHLFVKGGDYATKELPEAEAVHENGGEIILLPLIPDRSTSKIIQEIHLRQPTTIEDELG